MLKHLQAFMRGTQGIPWGEAVMPMYRFANPDLRSLTSITYNKERRGQVWWFKRQVKITHPGAYNEDHYQWFGPFEDEYLVELGILNDKDRNRSDEELYVSQG